MRHKPAKPTKISPIITLYQILLKTAFESTRELFSSTALNSIYLFVCSFAHPCFASWVPLNMNIFSYFLLINFHTFHPVHADKRSRVFLGWSQFLFKCFFCFSWLSHTATLQSFSTFVLVIIHTSLKN